MTTARLVVFGGTHLGFDSAVNARVERRRRGDDFEANFDRVLKYAGERAADVLVHCGDFFHRSRVRPSTVDSAFERLAAVAEAGIPVLIVPGNHDRSRLPPSLWLGHPNIHVFERPKTVHLDVRGLRLAFSGFPFAWGDLRSRFPLLAEQTGLYSVEADAAFLCMHHTVAGASVGPRNFTFRRGREVLLHQQLPREVAAVLAGHIHRHQVLKGDHPPVLYPGSTERTSFAERDEPKGFLDVTVESCGGDHPELGWRFVELPARPMVDLVVPSSLEDEELNGFLVEAAGALPSDAVVRFKTTEAAKLPDGLGASALRSIFPSTMNVQVSGEVARGHR